MSVARLSCPLLARVCVLCVGGLAAEKPEPPKPASRTNRQIEGWTVRVDDRLLAPPHDPSSTVGPAPEWGRAQKRVVFEVQYAGGAKSWCHDETGIRDE